MKKINNTVKHDPENGIYGDCHRVCFAMILGLEAEEVPHFWRDGDAGAERGRKEIKEFLTALGLGKIEIAFDGSDLDNLLMTMAHNGTDVPYILGGTSRIGVGHSVVCLNDKIFHDPTGNGIVGPMEDGFYWITVFSKLA